MNTVAIIQARATSERLPGKVLADIAGKPMVWHVVDRLRRAKQIDDVVLAIPDSSSSDVLEQFANEYKIAYFRGSEHDVLARYYGAAKAFSADTIIRVTSDCPLIDPDVVDMVVDVYKERTVDYASNILERTMPRGLDTEAFSFDLLERSYNETTDPEHREHVTLYPRQYPERFSVRNVQAPAELHRPDLRLTVDTKEDMALIQSIFANLHQDEKTPSTQEVIDFLDAHPEIRAMNAKVQQKTAY